jgi:hypothetical protein
MRNKNIRKRRGGRRERKTRRGKRKEQIIPASRKPWHPLAYKDTE